MSFAIFFRRGLAPCGTLSGGATVGTSSCSVGSDVCCRHAHRGGCGTLGRRQVGIRSVEHPDGRGQLRGGRSSSTISTRRVAATAGPAGLRTRCAASRTQTAVRRWLYHDPDGQRSGIRRPARSVGLRAFGPRRAVVPPRGASTKEFGGRGPSAWRVDPADGTRVPCGPVIPFDRRAELGPPPRTGTACGGHVAVRCSPSLTRGLRFGTGERVLEHEPSATSGPAQAGGGGLCGAARPNLVLVDAPPSHSRMAKSMLCSGGSVLFLLPRRPSWNRQPSRVGQLCLSPWVPRYRGPQETTAPIYAAREIESVAMLRAEARPVPTPPWLGHEAYQGSQDACCRGSEASSTGGSFPCCG